MLGQSDARTNDTAPAQIGERGARAKIKKEKSQGKGQAEKQKDPYRGYLDTNSRLQGKITSAAT